MSNLFPLSIPSTSPEGEPIENLSIHHQPITTIPPTYNYTGPNISGTEKWEWPALTMEELINAAPSKASAPGLDQIDWIITKAAISAIPDFFFQAYRTLFESGYHPWQWGQAVGVIIPKRNKKDYSSPKAY